MTVWTDEETARLREMVAAGKDMAAIARTFGRKIDYVRDRWRYINMTPEQRLARRERIRAVRNRGRIIPARIGWTEEQKRLLIELREKHCKSWADISKAIGKPSGTVYSKYYYLKNTYLEPRESVGATVRAAIPRRNEDEWRRRQALYPRDLTSALMGDPLPGYSALERRT